MLLVAAGLLAAADARSAPSLLRGIGLDESLARPPDAARMLEAMPARPGDLPLFVRLSVARADLEPSPGRYEFGPLNDRVAIYHRLGCRIVVDLGPMPAEVSAAESWRAFTRALALRFQGRARAYQLSVPAGTTAREAAFILKIAAVEIRAADTESLVVIEGLARTSPEWWKAFYAEGLAPYVDALAVGYDPASAAAVEDLGARLAQEDPEAALVMGAVPVGDEAADGVSALLRWEFSHMAGPVALTTYAGAPAALAAAVGAAGALADALFDEVVPLDPGAAAVTLDQAAGEPPVRTELLYNTRRFATYVAYWRESGTEGKLKVALSEPTGRAPVVRGGFSTGVAPVEGFAWNPSGNRASMSVPVSSIPRLLDFNYAGAEVKATRVDVTERVLPLVGEVIFRHQQVQAAQDNALYNYIATMRMEQHFRPSATDPGFDVVTENVFYSARDAVEWEETSFSVNGSKWGVDRPPFPLLQPEKVLSLPLDLRLDADYSYRLERVDTEAGRECYVVRFTPVDDTKSLYKGSVWIDSATYERVKLQAVQTKPGSPVLSNEEIHHFTAAGAAGGRRLHLLERLTGRQIILVAGRNLLLEREVRFSGFKVNSPDFAARRDGSRRSESIMYRDTQRGLRYLVKRDGERVVADRATTSARALAIGTVVDPSYDFPLPVLGLNYLDFDFLGKNSQLALLFGGVLALVNVQRPQILGPRVDLNFDLFAIAVSGNDRVYDAEGERVGEELMTRPFSTGLNLGFQFTDFQKLTGSYQLRYDSYKASDDTAAGFVVPSNTATHAFGLAYEYRRGGYTLQASGFFNWRASWEPWGTPADYDPEQRDYLKYGASFSKDFFAGLHKFRVNLAYFGGRDLDRFSMYQFGLFDETRIHGVPTGGVRFPELAMLRGTYSLNLLEMYRLDVFVDQAFGRDPDPGTEWRPITGLGLGFNLRGPFRTLVRGEVGKSFLPELYSGAGSYNAQITFLKPI